MPILEKYLISCLQFKNLPDKHFNKKMVTHSDAGQIFVARQHLQPWQKR